MKTRGICICICLMVLIPVIFAVGLYYPGAERMTYGEHFVESGGKIIYISLFLLVYPFYFWLTHMEEKNARKHKTYASKR